MTTLQRRHFTLDSMKLFAALLLVVLILSACDDPPEKPNPLIGTWLLTGTNLAGRTFETRLIVDSTNGYTSQVSIPASEDENLPAYFATAGGYLLVTNGMLIDTMTHTSDTNANPLALPSVDRGRIIWLDYEILTVQWMESDSGSVPTNPVTLRKVMTASERLKYL